MKARLYEWFKTWAWVCIVTAVGGALGIFIGLLLGLEAVR